jgi:DNA-binding MarR family transcriptional regulator
MSQSTDSQAVMDFIRQIVHALEVGSRSAQTRTGLSGAQLFILQILARGGAMSVNELAAQSHTHQSSVSVVVSRLVDADLVNRTKSVADARRLELTVTSAGRRALKSTFVTPQERLIDSLNSLSPARLAKLRSILREVVLLSGMHDGTPPMFFERQK